MAKIPENIIDPVADAIYQWHESIQGSSHRPHLGGSMIGDDCKRKLWYLFRWALEIKHAGKLLRLFETGQLEEARFNRELRAIGCTVNERDPKTGKQYIISAHGGHFGGSLDAIVYDVPGGGSQMHVGEYKTHSEKSFSDLLKNGVEISKPTHFAQMQIYMLESSATRALYLAKNKNTDQVYSERIKLDKPFAESLLLKAKEVIESPVPPHGISEDPTFYKCKFCDFQSVCQLGKAAQATCRTCSHSTANTETGEWDCEKHGVAIPVEQQRIEQPCHLMIPDLVPYAKPVDFDGVAVTYETESGKQFKNGGDGFKSGELHHLNAASATDAGVAEIRAAFDGKVIGHGV